MKKAAIVLTSFLLMACSLLFLPLLDGKGAIIEIPGGCSGYEAAKISSIQLIPHCRKLVSASFLLTSSMYGSAKPGVYVFDRTSAFSAMRSVCRGDRLKITVSEGMTVLQIVSLIRRTLKLPADDPMLTSLQKSPSIYEGKLFPAVYQIFSSKPDDLIAEMIALSDNTAKKYSITFNDLILASIIQKETRYSFEMKRCAGVLTNRIKRGMMLECDTILMYGVGTQRITKGLIAQDSPYNSFMRKGLPPSPICSPGIDALKAAMEPEQNDYLYFVAKKDGHLYFSKNKHEHFKAVELYMLGRPNGFRPRAE
jgi:UPF0755 protein